MTTNDELARNTIIVGIDDTGESAFALDHAAGIAAAQGADLIVTHVRDQAGVAAAAATSVAAAAELEATRTAIEARLTTEVTAHLRGHPGHWRLEVRTGNPGRTLTEAADEVDADLIVVGHRRLGAVGDLLLGSVASHVVHNARRSVLVAVPKRTP